MTTTEIKQAGSTFLRLRLAVVSHSTIPSQAAEAATIIAELTRRGGAFLK